MATSLLRIGLIGCGFAARVHLDRLLGLEEVEVVGFADPDLDAARSLASKVALQGNRSEPPAFADHRELLKQTSPDAVAIFTPHFAHYRPAMDALQAGCHLFIEKPLSTNVQEAADIVGLARGRGRTVGVGHQYRLSPSLVTARQRLAEGAIGPVRFVSATLANPWIAAHRGSEDSWRFSGKVAGAGILADTGDHLLDSLLWLTGKTAVEVAAIQDRHSAGPDLVTAAALKFSDGTPASIGISGVSPSRLFELNVFGEQGRLRLTDQDLIEEIGTQPARAISLPEAVENIDQNFVRAILHGTPLCCSAEEAQDTVRLLEAIVRSGASGQLVRLA